LPEDNEITKHMNLYTTLTGRWEPRSTAIVTPTETTLFADLMADVARAAGWLASKGVRSGDVVALQLPRSVDWIVFFLGAISRGVVVVPVHRGASAEESAFLCEDASAKLHIHDVPVGWRDAKPAVAIDVDSGALAAICYTSGTTGHPKGACLTHGGVLANLDSLHGAWGWSPDDVLVHSLPLFHIHGLIVAQLGALYAGARTVWLQRFEPAAVMGAIEVHRATVFMGVPTFYHRLLRWNGSSDLDSMRLFTSGSAPLPAATHTAFRRRYGHDVLERYGMTEVGIVLSNPLVGERRSGTVGHPLPGVEARLVNDRLQDVSYGVGQLLIRSKSMFREYLGRPEATANAQHDGWMKTGDLAIVEDGYYRIVGRMGDMVITGGENVYPVEVEAALMRVPGVAEAVVVGVPDPDLGERVVATLVGAGATEAVLAGVRESLSRFKVPRAVRWVDALPRNRMGKIDRRLVRQSWSAPLVRDAIPEDADWLVAGNIAMALETEGLVLDRSVIEPGVSRVFTGDKGAFYLIAQLAGVAVGQCMVTSEWSDWRNAEVWWLQSVYVAPSARGCGVYRALHDAVVGRARENGVVGLRLYVDRTNENAQAVYRRVGMDGDHYLVFEQMFG
jgi:malonyl-CoA/methylmalonyl-CoA synthetase